ncbi:hypothetical protein DSO57_1006752 [Entomophthora muscae]|uniref:Uncharacterized protein n=1 Tax=Entomophthora muscae TaxID=34485 RepID=A0ACC2RMA5_9FUNG|nr:hypothetical protein DSO57_1006752 [Entomophthora muscae]
MCKDTDKLKKEHILSCLHPTCQEVVVPELPSIVTWEDMKCLLIEEFGGDLILEVKCCVLRRGTDTQWGILTLGLD